MKEARRQAEQRVAAEVGPQGDSRLAPLAGLTSKAVAALLRSLGAASTAAGGPPLPTDLIADAIEQHGEPAVRGALLHLERRLGTEATRLVAEPHQELARALGHSLKERAQRRPLVFIQDTYEIVEPADPILRDAIVASGGRLLWVIAGRGELASSRGARHRVGYQAMAGSFRLHTLAEIGEFSLTEVAGFLTEAVPERPLPQDGASRIHRATAGIPWR